MENKQEPPLPEQTCVDPFSCHKPGVYSFLGSGGDVLYVGQTNKLSRRASQHAEKPWFTSVAQTLFVEIDNVDDRLWVETRLILAHRPPYNQTVWLSFDEKGEARQADFSKLRVSTTQDTGEQLTATDLTCIVDLPRLKPFRRTLYKLRTSDVKHAVEDLDGRIDVIAFIEALPDRVACAVLGGILDGTGRDAAAEQWRAPRRAVRRAFRDLERLVRA